MMSRAFALLLLAVAVPATAQDERIQTRHYDPLKVVEVRGRVGVQATIAFADDEQIENVAVGDSAQWQVTPNKRANLLFVKPTAATARTNMTVVTDRRTYLFDLVAQPRSAPLYVLRFTYPPERQAVGAPVVVVAAEPAPVPRVPVLDLNFGWVQKGDRKLSPARLFDDGKATYLTWARDVTLPAILQRDGKGNEGPVNFSTDGEYTVVEGVPQLLVLRSGKAMLELIPTPKLRPAVRAAAADVTPSAGAN